MKLKRKTCGITALLSLLLLIGVAGNSDLGLEPDLGRLVLKVLIGLVVFAASLRIGGFIE